jgi:predicted  nucleic acid-binding Zn-ribbon protein
LEELEGDNKELHKQVQELRDRVEKGDQEVREIREKMQAEVSVVEEV